MYYFKISRDNQAFLLLPFNFCPDAPALSESSLTTNLAGTFIEEYTDLDVIVFVQNYATKEIMQSFHNVQQLGNETFTVSKIKVYPNPSNGLITIDTATAVNVTVTDLLGKVVYNAKDVNNQSPLNLSHLQKGMYLVKMANTDGEQTEKIILK